MDDTGVLRLRQGDIVEWHGPIGPRDVEIVSVEQHFVRVLMPHSTYPVGIARSEWGKLELRKA